MMNDQPFRRREDRIKWPQDNWGHFFIAFKGAGVLSFPMISTIIVFSFDISVYLLWKALVSRKNWITKKNEDSTINMMINMTFSALFSSLWSLGLNIIFKYFIINKLLESISSYLSNLFLVILGLSAAEIFYRRPSKS